MTNSEHITITLPLPGKRLSPNCPVGSIGGRMAKAAVARKYRRLAKEAVLEEEIETMPWNKVSVHTTFYHKVNRRRDTDNAIGSLKSAYDGIVDSGLVPDDDHKHMERTMPEFLIDKASPRLEMTIKRLL